MLLLHSLAAKFEGNHYLPRGERGVLEGSPKENAASCLNEAVNSNSPKCRVRMKNMKSTRDVPRTWTHCRRHVRTQLYFSRHPRILPWICDCKLCCDRKEICSRPRPASWYNILGFMKQNSSTEKSGMWIFFYTKKKIKIVYEPNIPGQYTFTIFLNFSSSLFPLPLHLLWMVPLFLSHKPLCLPIHPSRVDEEHERADVPLPGYIDVYCWLRPNNPLETLPAARVPESATTL